MSDLEIRVERLESDRQEMKLDIREIKTKMETAFPDFATKADVMALNASFEKTLRLVIMWNVGTVIASTGVVATIVFAILRYGV